METKQVVVTGTICELQRVIKTFKSGKKSEEKLFISLKNVNVNDKKMEIFKQAFAEVKKNFIPAWVDDFKGYNDSMGHQQGDECIVQVADAIRSMEKEHGLMRRLMD